MLSQIYIFHNAYKNCQLYNNNISQSVHIHCKHTNLAHLFHIPFCPISSPMRYFLTTPKILEFLSLLALSFPILILSFSLSLSLSLSKHQFSSLCINALKNDNQCYSEIFGKKEENIPYFRQNKFWLKLDFGTGKCKCFDQKYYSIIL